MTIYPSDWFEIVDDCRLNLNNKNQVLFPDGYGEHVFDKRTKVNEFLSKLDVRRLANPSQNVSTVLNLFRVNTAMEVTSMLRKNFVPVSCM